MSDSIARLTRKIGSAADLLSVVRTMKAMTAANINQYERAVSALEDYYRTVQLGLAACFQQSDIISYMNNEFFAEQNTPGKMGVLVFGSDQGLVGQFNDSLAEFVLKDLADQKGDATIWVVGERLRSQFAQADITQFKVTLETDFTLPKDIHSITPLVGDILLEMETRRTEGKITEVMVYHNRLNSTKEQSRSIYTPTQQRLLPLDRQWQHDLMDIPWPSSNLPEVVNAAAQADTQANARETQLALIHEYLFVSLYRACAESLASENASRLAAMQRAEKNIDELLEDLGQEFHRLRQRSIDEELFDVVAGYEVQGSRF